MKPLYLAESSVYEVTWKETPIAALGRQIELSFRDFQTNEHRQESFVLAVGLLLQLELEDSHPDVVAKVLLKNLDRLRDRHSDQTLGHYTLTTEDLPYLKSVSYSYEVLDARIARLMYKFFTVAPSRSLELEDLQRSLDADDDVVANRAQFFLRFGFIDAPHGDYKSYRPTKEGYERFQEFIKSRSEVKVTPTPAQFSVRATDPKVEITDGDKRICGAEAGDGGGCQQEAYEEQSGLCILHSKDSEKNKDDFKKKLIAELLGPTDEALYLTDVLFPECDWFPSHKRIKRPVVFSGCKFLGKHVISDGLFERDVRFYACEFLGSRVDFEKTCFPDVRFDHILTNGPLSFTQVSFLGPAVFIETASEGTYALTNRREFNEADFQERGKVRFIRFDFRDTLFRLSSLRGVQFIDCVWPQTNSKLWNRHTVANELNLGLSRLGSEFPETLLTDEFENCAQLCRDIQSVYAEQGHYSLANSFYASEKEQERRIRAAKGSKLNLHVLYKLVSNYGQSIGLPLVAGAIVLLIFTTLMMVVGDINGIGWDWGGNPWVFLKACVYNFSMTFNRSLVRFYIGDQPSLQALHLLESALIIVLLSLAVMSINRRFRRRTK